MGIGASVFLIAVGAIITFGVNANGQTGWLNVDAIGWVLIAVGLFGLALTYQRSRASRRRRGMIRRMPFEDEGSMYPGEFREEYHEHTELHPEDRH